MDKFLNNFHVLLEVEEANEPSRTYAHSCVHSIGFNFVFSSLASFSSPGWQQEESDLRTFFFRLKKRKEIKLNFTQWTPLRRKLMDQMREKM